MKCITCSKLNLQAHPKHVAVGMGQCTAEPLPGMFVGIGRDRPCEMHAAASADVIQKRVEWWAKQ